MNTGIRSESYTIAISQLLLFIYPGLIRFPSGIPKPYDNVFKQTKIWMRPVYNKYPELGYIKHLNHYADKINHIHLEPFDDIGIEISMLKELELCNNTAFVAEENKIREWEMILKYKGTMKISVDHDVLIPNYICIVWLGSQFCFTKT